jgi:hypothetical protein
LTRDILPKGRAVAQYGPQEWFYATGELAANQRAAVFGPGDSNAFAPIFSDAGLTIPTANPTVTDGAGELTFYAPDGEYWIFVGPVGTGDSIQVNLGAPVGAVDSVNGQTGVVVLSASDVGAQPIGTIDAKGDLYAGTGPDATSRLPVGADGEVLSSDSTAPAGLKWVAGGGGSVTSVNGQTGVVVLTATDVGADVAGAAAAAAAASQPIGTISAKGDLYAGTANDATARQGVGTNGQVLTADSAQTTGMRWSTPTAAPVTSVNGFTGVVVLSAANVGADVSGAAAAAAAASQPLATVTAKGDLYAGTASATTARRSVGTNGQVLTADSTQATGMSWSTPTAAPVTSVNSQTGVVVLSAANVGAQPIATLTTKGDLYVATASATVVRRAVGTDGQVLTADSAQADGVKWALPASAPVTSVNSQTGVVVLSASDVGAPPTSRQIIAGTALTGGGDLSADRTLNVVLGTSGASAAAGNDSRIVGAQQLSTLTTKGDLYVATASATSARQGIGTDGQVLTADSAQTNGLKWAAATDAGAVPKSTVTTKGDLIVATASATVTRRAVGTDGQVLTADSAQTDGVKWATAGTDAGAQQRSTLTTKGDLYVATASATTARLPVGTDGYGIGADSTVTNGMKWRTPPSGAFMPRSTGYSPTGGVVTARSSKTAPQDTMYLIPFYLMIGATLTSISFEVSGAIALAVVRLGIYGSDATTMLPTGAAVADYGTTIAATTGTKTAAVSTALTPGLWWLAFVGQVAAPTVRQCTGWTPYVASATFPSGSGVGWDNCYVQTGVSGALPTIGSLADSDGPMCGIKF